MHRERDTGGQTREQEEPRAPEPRAIPRPPFRIDDHQAHKEPDRGPLKRDERRGRRRDWAFQQQPEPWHKQRETFAKGEEDRQHAKHERMAEAFTARVRHRCHRPPARRGALSGMHVILVHLHDLVQVLEQLIAKHQRMGSTIDQLDLRIGKVLRFGAQRATVSVDMFNALNADTVLTYNQAFTPGGAWLVPTTVLTARTAKVTVQYDF